MEQLELKEIESLRNVPDGFLRIAGKSGDRPKYYHRSQGSDSKEKYIKKKDISIAKELAQKDYNLKVLESVLCEIKSINKMLEQYCERDLSKIYDELHPERQKLVTPIWESDEMYIKKWKSFQYEPLEFKDENQLHITLNEEKVRSKSECIIANLIYHKGIPYLYEKPLILNNKKVVYPDFTLLDVKHRKEIYLEHLGMMDLPDYAERTVKKLQEYERNGIYIGKNLILTYETSKTPLDTLLMDKMLNVYFNS